MAVRDELNGPQFPGLVLTLGHGERHRMDQNTNEKCNVQGSERV